MKIKAAIMTIVGGPLEITELELEGPKEDEVLVKMAATSICHSDLNALLDPSTPTPAVLGHEGAGEVVEVGRYVTRLKPGDKVALNWVPFCGYCDPCLTGSVHLCDTIYGPMFAGTLLDGTTRLKRNGNKVYHYSLLSTFAEYVVVSERSCVKLPEEMPLVPAALIGCGVATGFCAAIHAAQVTPGSSVAVFGIGGVGVNALQGAKIAGAEKIIACDVKPSNLKLAHKFGATHVINCSEGDVDEALQELTTGRGVDFAIDCTGHTNSLENAWRGTRRGGTVIALGAFNQEQVLQLPAYGFHRESKLLRGSFYGDCHPFRDFPLIAKLYLHGKLNLDDLILGTMKLEQINSAWETFKRSDYVNVGRQVVLF